MKFDFGDVVIFEEIGFQGDSMTRMGAVVGITPVENEDQVQVFGHPLGTVLYTVEFSDGTDKLLPEGSLERESPDV
jgi:hypothetical protein